MSVISGSMNPVKTVPDAVADKLASTEGLKKVSDFVSAVFDAAQNNTATAVMPNNVTASSTAATAATAAPEAQTKTAAAASAASTTLFTPGKIYKVINPEEIIETLRKSLIDGKKPAFVFDYDGVFTENNPDPATRNTVPFRARNKEGMLKLIKFLDDNQIPAVILTGNAGKVSSCGNIIKKLFEIDFNNTTFAKTFPMDKHEARVKDRKNIGSALAYPYIQSHLNKDGTGSELIIATGCIGVGSSTDKDEAIKYIQERQPAMNELYFIDDSLGNTYDILMAGKKLNLPTVPLFYECETSYGGSEVPDPAIPEVAKMLQRDPEEIRAGYKANREAKTKKTSSVMQTRVVAVNKDTRATGSLASRQATFADKFQK